MHRSVARYITSHAWGMTIGAVIGSFVAVVVGLAVSWAKSIGMQVWIDQSEADPSGSIDNAGVSQRSTSNRWRARAVEHPAGVAASWSAIYGGGYVLLAWLLGWLLYRSAHPGDVPPQRVQPWMIFGIAWFVARSDSSYCS